MNKLWLPPHRYEAGIPNYFGPIGERFEEMNTTGRTVLRVLPMLTGQPMDDYALGLIHSLRPSVLRISTGEITTDAITWRVTVHVKDSKILGRVIEYIEQEVEVGLPAGVQHGHDLDCQLRKRGVDIP